MYINFDEIVDDLRNIINRYNDKSLCPFNTGERICALSFKVKSIKKYIESYAKWDDANKAEANKCMAFFNVLEKFDNDFKPALTLFFNDSTLARIIDQFIIDINAIDGVSLTKKKKNKK